MVKVRKKALIQVEFQTQVMDPVNLHLSDYVHCVVLSFNHNLLKRKYMSMSSYVRELCVEKGLKIISYVGY